MLLVFVFVMLLSCDGFVSVFAGINCPQRTCVYSCRICTRSS